MFIVVALAGIALDLPALAVLGASVLLAIGLAWLAAEFSLDNVQYKRELTPRRLFPGEEAEMQVTVENRKFLPLAWLRIVDPFDVHIVRNDRRLEDVTRRAQRGADVGGLVRPLEADAGVTERDLIVAAATRRDDERDRARAHALRAELIARAAEVNRIVDACVAAVRSAPTLAVPRVEALGPVPDDALAVDAYLVRLANVARALALAEQTYSGPLAELDSLRQLLDVYHAKAAAIDRADRPEVGEIYRQAVAVLGETPTDLPRAHAVVAAYQTLLSGASSSPASSGRTA
jgi:hypothetical protein